MVFPSAQASSSSQYHCGQASLEPKVGHLEKQLFGTLRSIRCAMDDNFLKLGSERGHLSLDFSIHIPARVLRAITLVLSCLCYKFFQFCYTLVSIFRKIVPMLRSNIPFVVVPILGRFSRRRTV